MSPCAVNDTGILDRRSCSGSSSSSCEGGGRLEPKASLPPTMRKSLQIRQLPALSPPQFSAGGWEDEWEVRSRRPGNWLHLSTSSRRGTRGPQPPQDCSIWSCLQLLCLCISVRPAAFPLFCVVQIQRNVPLCYSPNLYPMTAGNESLLVFTAPC